ncbi:MAG: hypothetical protein NZ853_05170 [Leptospiraceae bacterium]|nr:hypothetical protein [Leptospiraceae bacterium]MDW7976662.1 ArsA-related P-loop ATPase [Leptospiraceae bacterium]
MDKKPKLHIFLGAGGVGKTTLSASFSLYLASIGRKVGLLSIDPAKRLRTALNFDNISEKGSLFWKNDENGGEIRVAILNLPDSLKRWIQDEGLTIEHQKQLFEHPLYQTLAEKIASAVETLAPIRMAEWIEQYPETEDLVIDTAPGIHAIDFILRPERLLAFFDSKILQWIKWFGGEEKYIWVNGKKQVISEKNFFQKLLRMSAKSILSALGKAGGENILLSLAELILLMDQIFYKMVNRLQEARDWIKNENTSVYFVFSSREDSVAIVLEIYQILQTLFKHKSFFIFNQTIPELLYQSQEWKDFISQNEVQNKIDILLRTYLENYPKIKQSIYEKLHENSIEKQTIIEVPLWSSIETQDNLKIKDLIQLGSLMKPSIFLY